MADDIFDKKKIIAALRAKGVPEKDIEKLYGPLPKIDRTPNSSKHDDFRKKNEWKYNNKNARATKPATRRLEDIDPDYEPIDELREDKGPKGGGPKPKKPKKPNKPRISRKKPKPKPKRNTWDKAAEERLKTLWEAGYSLDDLAKEFKTTKDAITGKLTRMRNAGWRGVSGTQAPLPTPSIKVQKTASRLTPGMKRALANSLQKNFGVIGTFFSKRWGLIEPKSDSRNGGGGGADVTAAVIKGNQMVMTALNRLDLSIRRGTSLLNKTMAKSTSSMVDAITNTADLIKKQQISDNLMGGSGSVSPSAKPMNGSGGAAGIVAALLGGAGLAMLFNSRADAALDPHTTLSEDEINNSTYDQTFNTPGTPSATEQQLREDGAPEKNKQPPSEIEYKVKELSFEADSITFEADEFRYKVKGSDIGKPAPGNVKQQNTQNGDNGTQNGDSGIPSGSPLSGFGADGVGGAGAGMDGTGGGRSGGGGGTITPNGAASNAPANFKQRFDAVNDHPGASELSEEKYNEMFRGTPLEGKYGKIVSEAHKNGISPALMAAVIAHETGKGTSNMLRSRNNPAGLMDPATGMSTGKNFSTIEEGIEAAGRTIAKNWHKGGENIEGMAQRYAPLGAANDPGGLNSSWPSGVRSYIKKLEVPKEEASNSGTITPKANILTQEKLQEYGSSRSQTHMRIKDRDYVMDTNPNMDSDFAISQGNRDPNQFKNDWRDSLQPQDLVPRTGPDLSNAQKDSDDTALKERSEDAKPGKRSDAGPDAVGNAGASDTFHTTLLETEGPNHFEDFPMSDLGVGA